MARLENPESGENPPIPYPLGFGTQFIWYADKILISAPGLASEFDSGGVLGQVYIFDAPTEPETFRRRR